MSHNSFGHLFRVTTWGESHGPALGCVVDGCPPGLPLTLADLQFWLNRRRPGQSRFVTQRQEPDEVKILSGVFEDDRTGGPVTTGAPISLMIENVDQRGRDYDAIRDLYRPGHADYVYDAKYGVRDYRGGGRQSARETAARVAAGARAPEVGAVRLDMANYADWDPEALGRHVGYLPQEIGLLAGTIGENISRFTARTESNANAIDLAVVEAARLAGAHELVLRMPQAYDTKLGLGGVGVSPGQAQRIALARALFRNPALLVLDEPNSQLDGEGETALIEAVKAAKTRGAAILIVAHRAGVLAVADRLLVLRDGRVEMVGPREEITRRLAGAQADGGNLKPMRPREAQT